MLPGGFSLFLARGRNSRGTHHYRRFSLVMRHFLGLDIGSSSIKGAVLDVETQRIVSLRSTPFPEPLPASGPGEFTVDLSQIVTSLRSLLESLLAQTPSVAGILFCSQMGGLVLTDDRFQPVAPYFSWRDQRTTTLPPERGKTWQEELHSRWAGNTLQRLGNELRPGSATTLLYCLQQRNLLAGASWAMHLGDYLVAELCHAVPQTERTLGLGTIDLTTGTVPTDLFQDTGLGTLRWPALGDWKQAVGTVRLAGRDIPCYPAVGDQQAALLGAGLQTSELSVNISTGSQVSRLAKTFEPGEYQSRFFFDGVFLKTITHLPAGRSLNALVDLLLALPAAEGLSVRDPWGIISAAVEATPTATLQANLAFFSGTLPVGGALRNMLLENLTVGHLFRAAFNHMADNYAWCAARLDPRGELHRAVLSGGLPQKLPALREAITSCLKRELRLSRGEEETLTGLLQLATTL